MTRRYLILLLIILFSSCEKSQDKNEILKFYGDAYEDIGYSVAKVENGYVIAGQFTDIRRSGAYIEGSSKKMAVIKTGTDGNTIWKSSLGDRFPAVGSKILALDDGSVICVGYVIDTVTLKRDIFIVKLDADGTGTMQKIFKSPGDQYGADIIQTQEGYLILGTTDVERQPLTDSTGNVAGKKDILLVRINNNLELISSKAEGFPGNDEGAALKTDFNGGYTVVGTTDRSWPGQGANNILLLRINTFGIATQIRILGGTDDEYASDLEVLSDGYMIAGTVGSEGTSQSGYISKIPGNIFAAPYFTRKIKFVSTGSYSVKAVCRYKTNSFVMAGQAGTGSSAKMLIFVTDADGNPVEGKVMEAGSTGAQVAYDVISDDDDNIIAVGKNSYENNSMISLLKIRF